MESVTALLKQSLTALKIVELVVITIVTLTPKMQCCVPKIVDIVETKCVKLPEERIKLLVKLIVVLVFVVIVSVLPASQHKLVPLIVLHHNQTQSQLLSTLLV